jgi:HK97 family phage major capsid protein
MDLKVIEDLSSGVAKLRNTVEEAQKCSASGLTAIRETVEKHQTALDAVESKYDKLLREDQLDAKLKTNNELLIEKYGREFGEKLEALEAKLGRRATTSDQKSINKEIGALDYVVRKGFKRDGIESNQALLVEKYGPEAYKALTVANDTSGGYFTPVDFVNDIIQLNQIELSDMRGLVGNYSTTSMEVHRPTRQRHGGASWVGEADNRPETPTVGYGAKIIRTAELQARAEITREDQDNPLFDILGDIRSEIATAFSLTEDVEVLTGASVGNKPEGILNNPDIPVISSGVNDNISADAFISVTEAPKQMYLNGASWLFSRDTARRIRTLKDGEGRYLWAMDYAGKEPSMVLGFPYKRSQQMPNVSSGNSAILFGNLKAAYLLVDRLAVRFLVDPFSKANQGITIVYAWKRVGGAVMIPEALVKMVIQP